jgi:hypothetical protein
MLVIKADLTWGRTYGCQFGSAQPEVGGGTVTNSNRQIYEARGKTKAGYCNLAFRIHASLRARCCRRGAWTGGNSVQVSPGLGNVMLGSINCTLASGITGRHEP